MAVKGGWRAANVVPEDFAAATQWGTGVNPVHAVRAGIPRGDIKEPLGAAGPADMAPEYVIGPTLWGYQAEDAQIYPAEDYGYLRYDHPNWGETTVGRADRDGDIMAYGKVPQPEGWPSWGPANLDGDTGDFPLSGPPGGLAVRAYSDGSDEERERPIAIPGYGVSGGWLNKAHSEVNTPVTSDPAQYELATGIVQTSRQLDNGRATARGTDELRTPIANRLTGMKVKDYAKDWNMGGGPATPDLRPQDTDRIPKRPFIFRTVGAPALEAHTWNEITYFEARQRTVPDTAGSLVPPYPPASGYGYTPEDGSYY